MPDRILYRSDLSRSDDANEAWTTCAPRSEIEPKFSIDDRMDGWGDETAALLTRLPAVTGGQGKWILTVDAVTGGASYRLTVRFKTQGIGDPRGSVYARLLWKDADGGGLSHDKQEYFAAKATSAGDGDWLTITGLRKAPREAGQAELQLVAAWDPGARVWWSGVKFAESAESTSRSITVASVYLRPMHPSTPESNVDQFCAMIDKAGCAGADLCVLPEAITVVSVPDGSPAALAEPVPGPLSERLASHQL